MLKNQKPDLKTLDYYGGKWNDIFCEIYSEIVEKCVIPEQNNIRLIAHGGDSDPLDGSYDGWVVIIRRKMRNKKKIKVEMNFEK